MEKRRQKLEKASSEVISEKKMVIMIWAEMPHKEWVRYNYKLMIRDENGKTLRNNN
jgi:hypothetical protein